MSDAETSSSQGVMNHGVLSTDDAEFGSLQNTKCSTVSNNMPRTCQWEKCHWHVLGVGRIGTLFAHHLIRSTEKVQSVTLIYRLQHGANFFLNEMSGELKVVSKYSKEEDEREQSSAGYKVFVMDSEHRESEPIIENLLVTTKAYQVVPALQALRERGCIHPANTNIFLLVNGMGVCEEVARLVFPDSRARPRIFVGTTTHGCLMETRAGLPVVMHVGFGEAHFGLSGMEAEETLNFGTRTDANNSDAATAVVDAAREVRAMGDAADKTARDVIENEVAAARETANEAMVAESGTDRKAICVSEANKQKAMGGTLAVPAAANKAAVNAAAREAMFMEVQREPVALEGTDAAARAHACLASLVGLRVTAGLGRLPMRRKMLDKLAANACINPVTALLQCENGRLLTNPRAAALVKQLCQEVFEVLYGDQVSCDGDRVPFENVLNGVTKVLLATSANRSSMLQDLTNKRPTEIRYINGYVVQMAKGGCADAPLNSVMLSLILARDSLNQHNEMPDFMED